MKKYVSLLLLLPIFSVAQNCALKNDTDPITSEPKLVSGFVPFNASGYQFSVAVEASPKEINLFFLLENPSPCYNEYSTALVLLEGNRIKVNMKNNAGGSNCQGIFQTMYRNTAVTPAYLERLTSKKIATIQFKPSADDDKVISVSLSAGQQQQLLDLLTCIKTQAKTLIK